MTNNYFVLQVWVSDFSWLFIDKAIEITGEAVEEVLQSTFDFSDSDFNDSSFNSSTSSFLDSNSQKSSINPASSEFLNENLNKDSNKDFSENFNKNFNKNSSENFNKNLNENSSKAELLAVSPSSDNYKENPNSAFSSFIIRSQNPLDSAQSALLEYKSVIEKSFELQNPIIIKFESKIEKNEDWISKYKNAISPVCCGLFYIRPSWCPSLDSIKNELLAQNELQDSIESSMKNSLQDSIKTPSENSIESSMKDSIEFSNTKEITKDIESNFTKNAPSIEIIIDPALAFGSGHHASTANCLTFLSEIEKYLSFNKNIESNFKSATNLNSDSIESSAKIPNLRGFEILDIGCGSGILSIAASKLGANVSACDVDEMALNATKSNASLNAVEFAHLWCGSINEENPPNTQESPKAQEFSNSQDSIESKISPIKASLKDRFDIVLANIIAEVLVCLPITKCAKNGGLIILSGIINEQSKMVENHFKALNCELLEIKKEDGWSSILLKKL